MDQQENTPGWSGQPDEPEQAGSDQTGNAFRVIERAMELLNCLSRNPDGLTLTELSRETGLHKATALRFLKALGQGHFVAVSTRGKTWKLGPAIFEMSARALGSADLRALARPIMDAACQESGETVQLAVLSDESVVYVEKVEAPDLPLQLNTQIGSRRPIHCTGLGKAIAAFRDWNEIGPVIERSGFRRMTDRTITDAKALQREFADVRKQGFAIDNGEYNSLVVCAAAPIRNASGAVIAALSVSTVGKVVDAARLSEIVAIALAAAGAVSAKFGWRDKPATGAT